MTTRVKAARASLDYRYYGDVNDASELAVVRYDGTIYIDPKTIEIHFVETSAGQWCTISVRGHIYRKDGSVGLRTSSRQWRINRSSGPEKLPTWVTECLADMRHQLAGRGTPLPDWAAHIIDRQERA